jgi:Gpi18-like mannosyltransferase
MVHMLYLVGILLIGVSLVVRYLSYPLITSDYSGFLFHWVSVLHDQGLSVFKYHFADYAPLYLYFLRLLSFIPISSLYSIKTLSAVFDIVISIFVYRIVREGDARHSRSLAFFAAALTFSIPTLLIDSSVWAQSDAVYAAGIIASLYFLIRRWPLAAVLAFSFALSIKIQAIFFLPILIGYLLRERLKVLYIVIVPLFFFITLLPALLVGGPLSYWGLIFFKQAGEYPWLSVSAPSVFAFFNQFSSAPQAPYFFYGGILVAGAIAFCVMLYVAVHQRILRPQQLIAISLFCVLALPYFLPRMHERYFYLADVFSVLYVFFYRRQWFVLLIVATSSFLGYMPYLSSQIRFFAPFNVGLKIPATLFGLSIIWLIYSLIDSRPRRVPPPPPRPMPIVN